MVAEVHCYMCESGLTGLGRRVMKMMIRRRGGTAVLLLMSEDNKAQGKSNGNKEDGVTSSMLIKADLNAT